MSNDRNRRSGSRTVTQYQLTNMRGGGGGAIASTGYQPYIETFTNVTEATINFTGLFPTKHVTVTCWNDKGFLLDQTRFKSVRILDDGTTKTVEIHFAASFTGDIKLSW